MKFPKISLRVLGSLSIVLMLLVFVICGVFYWLLFTHQGQHSLSSLISTRLGGQGLRLELGDIDGQAPTPLQISSLKLVDDKGILIDMAGIDFSWSPYALLRGVLKIDELNISSIKINRLPESKGGSSFGLPLGLILAKLDIQHLDVSKLVDAKAKHVLSISGGFDLIQAQGQLFVQEENKKGTSFKIIKLPHAKNCEAELTDGGQGVFSNVLMEHRPFHAELKAAGEGYVWEGQLKTDLDQVTQLITDCRLSKDSATGKPAIDFEMKGKYQGKLKPFWQRILKDQVTAKGTCLVDGDHLLIKSASAQSDFFNLDFKGDGEISLDHLKGQGKLSLTSLAPIFFSQNFGYEGTSIADVNFDGNWHKLNLELGGMVGFENQGPIKSLKTQLTGSCTLVDFIEHHFVADFKANMRVGSVDSTLPYSWVDADLDVAGDYAYASDYLSLHHIDFSSDQLDLDGKCTLDHGDIDVCQLDGHLVDVAPLYNIIDLPVSGPSHVSITSEAVPEPLMIRLESETLKAREIDLDAVDVSFSFAQGNHTYVQLDYGGDKVPLFLSAEIKETDKNIGLENIKLWDKFGEINGKLLFSKSLPGLVGSLKGQIQTLDPFFRGLGLKNAAGKCEVDCQFKDQEIEALVKIRQLTSENLDLNLGVMNGSFKVDQAGDWRGKLLATFFDGKSDRWSCQELKFSADGTYQNYDFTLASKNILPGAVTINAEGSYAYDLDHQLNLKSLSGLVSEAKINLMKPVSLAWDQGNFDVDAFALKIGDGQFDLRSKLSAGKIDARIDLKKFPIALARLIQDDFSIEGDVTGHAVIKGQATHPEGECVLSSDNFDFSQNQDDRFIYRLGFKGKLNEQILQSNLNLNPKIEATKPLIVESKIPLKFDQYVPEFDPNRPLFVKANGDINLGDLMVLWPFENDVMRGNINVNMLLQGILADLRASGSVNLKNGYYENAEYGTELSNLSFNIEGAGADVALKSVKAESGDKGTLSGFGVMKLNQNCPYQVNVKLKSYPIIDNDEMDIVGDGDIKIEGDATHHDKISGKIVLAHAAYTLPSQISSDLQDIFDVEDEDAHVHLSRATALDLAVDIVKPMIIKGWGVESTWRGALNFKGTLKDPAMVGKLKVGQGEFNLFGPKFKITSGDIIFSEEQKMTPALAVRAESKAQDLNAIITVNGPASAPKFALTSQPDLPQDEILSRLLFKEGTANLSPYQALKLANLIGKFNGAPLPLIGQFEQIATTLGFDSFEIDANKKQGASPIVKFGKRLTDTIKASVEEDVEKRKTHGKLQVEVSPHVMLESGLSTEREGNIGLVGKWEY